MPLNSLEAPSHEHFSHLSITTTFNFSILLLSKTMKIRNKIQRALLAMCLFLIVSCNNTSSDKTSKDTEAETTDPIATTTPDSTQSAAPEKLEGTIIRQGELNDIFKAISPDNQTQIGQKVLNKQPEDAVNHDTITQPKNQAAAKKEIQEALKKMEEYESEK